MNRQRQRFVPRQIVAKTDNHANYIRSIIENVITIGVGPAGVGKTYLAVYEAVQLFKDDDKISRIIMTRPLIEAVEEIGFLPGDLNSKAAPYMRPMIDSMKDFLPAAEIKVMLECEKLEVCPLSFLRGRTFHNSIMILDEAQNTTLGGHHLFLARLGKNSKAIITGDPTKSQTDVDDSGLPDLIRKFKGKPDIGVVEFDYRDIMRSKHLSAILSYFED